MFKLRTLDSLSDKELCVLLFDEKVETQGDSKFLKIQVVDLLPRVRFKGHGTSAVNSFINHCREKYLPSTTVYGSIYHQEISLLERDAQFHRDRRNGFWGKFGFSIELAEDARDKMKAGLIDLRCL